LVARPFAAERYRLDRLSLPKYFDPPKVQVSQYRADWIDENGDVVTVVHLPHSSLAAFDADGRLYALRNYRARWVRFSAPRTDLNGAWEVTERALEVYSTYGRFLGAFSVPDALTEGWMNVAPDGRIFASGAAGSALVFANPVATGGNCWRTHFDRVEDLADRAPTPDSIVLSGDGVTR